MLIETSIFGNIKVDNDRIITFPEGLIGFYNIKRYTLINIDDNSPFSWLQAVDESHIAFLTVDPVVFKPDYRVSLTKETLSGLRGAELDVLLTVVIVTVPEDPKLMTANLKGPVIINTKTRIAKQITLNEDSYTTRHAIFAN